MTFQSTLQAKKEWHDIIYVIKEKKLQPGILWQTYIWKKDQKFYRKEKLAEFRLHKKCRNLSKWKRKGYNWKYKSYKRKNIIGKGKYIVRVVDQPLIKLAGRLKDKSKEIIRIYKK